MSPEVLRGKGYEWKSDIWSLGCILYELAVLKSPFKEDGLNLYSLFQKILQVGCARSVAAASADLRTHAPCAHDRVNSRQCPSRTVTHCAS